MFLQKHVHIKASPRVPSAAYVEKMKRNIPEAARVRACFSGVCWSCPVVTFLFLSGATQTALNFLILSAPQTLPEICSEQDEMDFLMEALIMRCGGGGCGGGSSHLVYITLVHTQPAGSTHILRQQRHLFCVGPLGGARCITVVIKKRKEDFACTVFGSYYTIICLLQLIVWWQRVICLSDELSNWKTPVLCFAPTGRCLGNNVSWRR